MALSVAVVVTTDGWATAAWKDVSNAPKASSSPESEVTWMFRWKLGSMVSEMGYFTYF